MPAQSQPLRRETPRRQEYPANDAQSENAHGVTCLHAQADDAADGQPPARIFRLQQPGEKVGYGDAPQVIERYVLKYSSLNERNRSNAGSYCRHQLRVPLSAEFFCNQPGEHHDRARGDCREDAKACE